MKEFQLISLREEEKLSLEELESYYSNLRAFILSRKLKTTTKGALTIAPRLKKIVNRIDAYVTEKLAGGKVEIITDGTENIPAGAVLFANTHQGILDNICWIPSNPRHCVVLHTADAKKSLIWAQLCTGLVLVNKNDKNDKTNRMDAKLDMIHILLKGHAIMYYPEGTWNLSPNKLHLPMSYGFLEVAKKAGAPVVPVVTEFTYDTTTERERIVQIHIRYGKPIYIALRDTLSEKLKEYEEAISTMRWDLFAEKGSFKRSDISNRDYINFLKGIYHTLELKDPKLTVEQMLEIERRNIRGASSDFYLFHHINEIPFNEMGELLETDETIRLRKLYDEHCKWNDAQT